MNTPQLPEYFQPITGDQSLAFSCHPGVPCFTECCRELDLALTPYDALRLKRALHLTSGRLLEAYVIIEWEEQQLFPTCYLTMVDDGRASCVFVREAGCSVYGDRPGSCRAYPVGRGASRTVAHEAAETLVLIREAHCRGFAAASTQQTIGGYLLDQGLAPYNRFNDALLPLLQHPHLQHKTFRPTRRQLDQYILALYNLDQFRLEMTEGRITLRSPLTPQQLTGLTGDDEALLLLGIRWLMQEFFDE